MRQYSPPVRTRTSGAQDGGRNEQMRDNNFKFQDGNIFPKTVESDVKDSTESGSREVRERTGLHPEDTGKPRVSACGMLAPERHKMNFVFLR